MPCSAAKPGNAFFGRAMALVPQTDPRIKYALGPILMNRTWNEGGEPPQAMRRLPRIHFYFIPPSQTYRFFYGPSPALPGEPIPCTGAPATTRTWRRA